MKGLNQLGLKQEEIDRITASLDGSADPEGAPDRLLAILSADPTIAADQNRLERAAVIAGTSRVLSTTLADHPWLLEGAREEDPLWLRARAALVQIAGDDLLGRIDLATAMARYSSVIDGLVAEALETARESILPTHPVTARLLFAVIALGKWGANELNYRSDIDLMFVHQPVPGSGEESRAAGLALASRLIAILSASSDGPGLVVDAGLRPEGSAGPLCRSLDSYTTYYRKWSEAWELQALLKARPAAGDTDLGTGFLEMASSVIWEEGVDAEALRSIRQIKGRAEAAAPPSDIKRSRGGIRDVEFAVQILQLVHGRFDPDLRVRSTLEAIVALDDHGYIESEHATRLAEAYRFLRHLEHRIQLWDLRQTHLLPDDEVSRARLGRSLGFSGNPADGLARRLDQVRGEVRDLHERLYFRPILDSLVGVPSATLGEEDAALRLEALGFSDVLAAKRALGEMTAGLSRRSRVMHQVLPVMLDWLARSPDPDLGLAQLRVLLAHSPDHAALVTILQNNPVAGERLCLLLGTGRMLGDLMDRIPEFIPRLADDALIADIQGGEEAAARLVSLLDSRPDREVKIGTIRRFIRRRKLRIAARDVLGEATVETTLEDLSGGADAALIGALHILTEGQTDGFGVIAMGKWGGRELSYESDIDLMYVFADDTDRDRALQLATGLDAVLSEPSRHGEGYALDTGLRPEGRAGPMARSCDSYRRYYSEWVEAWELLALVRARPAAGDASLHHSFSELLDEVLWGGRLPSDLVRQIRAIKARVESERIPPDEDPDFHLKLGPGALSDVEFLVQLLQLQHGGAEPGLRTTSTLEGLQGLHETGLISSQDHLALRDSYLFCTKVRMRLHLQKGRPTDSLPTDRETLASLAVSLGFERTSELREEYLRFTRRARRTFENLFYAEADS